MLERAPVRTLVARTAAAAFMLLLAGCQSLLNFTPERAVLQAIPENHARSIQKDSSSIRILQRQSFLGKEVLLATFQGQRDTGEMTECVFIYEAINSRTGWRVGSSGGSCGPLEGDSNALGIGSGSSWSSQEGGLSDAYGLIYETEIQAVEITWDDGLVQSAQIAEGSYMALREGKHDVIKVLGLDEQGEAIFSHMREPIPPEKQLPNHNGQPTQYRI